MGMYTEFHYNVELRRDTPERVIQSLMRMLGGEAIPGCDLPRHPLFSTPRWDVMLRMDSAYFAADTHSTLRQDRDGSYFLCVRCNLKNYDGEIEKFCEWLDPFVAGRRGDFLGFYRHEQSENPELIRKLAVAAD